MDNNKNAEYPLITIGVSAYNRANYLPYCLDSLLKQSYPNCEIIVVDDGSTDDTAALMREKYPQIKYVQQENGGDASAKNHVSRIASGKYIVFNDSDDIFYPDAVERLYEALDKDDQFSCSYGTYQTIDADGVEMPTKRKVAEYPSGDITCDLLKHIIVNSCGTLMPLAFFRQCGGFDTSLRVCHDWSLFLTMSLQGKFNAVQEPVFWRRRHGGNISSASYGKIKTAFGVFEQFVENNPQTAEKYAAVIKRRRADFHRKLYREAAAEKLDTEALRHARAAFRLKKSVKNFCNLCAAYICSLGS